MLILRAFSSGKRAGTGVWQKPRPFSCDVCSRPIIRVFVEGQIRQGPWGIMCPGCYRVRGRQGTVYKQRCTDGKFIVQQ